MLNAATKKVKFTEDDDVMVFGLPHIYPGARVLLPGDGVLFNALNQARLIAQIGTDGDGKETWPVWGWTHDICDIDGNESTVIEVEFK
jgi:hypothetical protein